MLIIIKQIKHDITAVHFFQTLKGNICVISINLHLVRLDLRKSVIKDIMWTKFFLRFSKSFESVTYNIFNFNQRGDSTCKFRK